MTVENCQPKTAENFENCQAKMTLDEVIAQHEYCLTLGFTACGDCKYRDTDGVCRMRENALLFLKEYREKKQEISDISADYVALKQYWAEQQENSPLSWDELKAMDRVEIAEMVNTLKKKLNIGTDAALHILAHVGVYLSMVS